MTWLSRNRLGARLVLASILVGSVLTIFATGFQLLESYLRQKNEASVGLEQVEAVLVETLEQALWKFDLQQVEVILDGLIANPAVSFLSLSTPTGQDWVRGEHENSTIARQFELEVARQGGDAIHLGALTVEVSLQRIVTSVKAQFWTTFLSNFAKAYIAAIALLLIFRRMVTRHLSKIALFVDAADPLSKKIGLQLDRAEGPEPDELDTISQAINGYEERVNQAVEHLTEEIRTRTIAEEEARSALSVKENFISTMSHEIRTPLNTILGLLHMIKLGAKDDAKLSEYTFVAMQAGNQLLDQLNNVLQMSSLDAHGVSFSPRETNLDVLVRQWSDEVTAKIEIDRKPIALEVVMNAPKDTILCVDGPKITQVVSNLASNALKFTDTGIIQLHVAYDPDSSLTIEVSDTGVGISKEGRQRIFERFAQLDEGYERQRGGAGLGLAICMELCALMGANLEVQTPRDARFSTTFVLNLPIR